MAGQKTLLSWSSGKDSAYALHLLQQDKNIELCGLITTINKKFKRIAMHGVRLKLLKQQAKQINLPLHLIELPYPCSNAEYEKIMTNFLNKIKADGIQNIAFGDLFLEDIKKYREEQMKNSGIELLFPCWGINTKKLSQEIIKIGIKAKITCLDPKKLPKEFAGHSFNKELLNTLPNNIDPCGENGEFHTFVYDSPSFQKPIKITKGESVKRDGFIFTDWL
ncbi:conserved hypothetical protein [Pyrococcus horikoshii]; COG2102: Predicted ATPases of PP-loop superfamily; IPR002761: Domain of unknown function DUF71 [hydrothermal vent metagenome]|uniref:Diphthamide synthase domain-containing protein n=1 Tax=hydrothermal vent metagenome TaxID=652676 RepID=A0A1W1CAT7_9ZZZZ